MSAIKRMASKVVETAYRMKKRSMANSRPSGGDSLLRQFAEDGYHIFRAYCSPEEVARLRQRYIGDTDKLPSHDGNIGFPFFDPAFMTRFFKSDVWKLLEGYGRAVYQRAPVLQIYPTIVVTKPTFTQSDFMQGTHRVPASYHTDFPSEMTVHIPLTDITAQTSHTRYCIGSHRSFKVRPQSVYAADVAEPFKQIELFANAGDMLAIDVTGIHRADVIRDSLRVMIQLKFTVPKRVMVANEIGKMGKKGRLSGAFSMDPSILREDLEFASTFAPASQLKISNVEALLRED